MAKDDPLLDTSHIVRVCKSSSIDENGHPQAPAFMLRSNEIFASVCWLETLGEDIAQNLQIQMAKELLNKKIPKMGNNAKLALLNVGQIRNEVHTHLPDFNLPILHAPTVRDGVVTDNSHAGIYNLPLETEDHGVAEFVAMAISAVFEAKIRPDV